MATVNRPANVCTSQWFILHPQQHNKNFSSSPHNLLPHSPTVIKKLFKTFPQDLNFAFKMGSRQISIRRATSAGYRMPDRTATKITSVSSVSLSKTHPGTRQIPSDREKEKQQTWGDAVRKDHVWREFVEAERRGEKLWHENWSFLKEYDSLGNKKEVETLPDNVPIFSDQVPNTTNQNIGSRIDTDLGKTLVYMDFLLTSGNQKKKLGADLQPC